MRILLILALLFSSIANASNIDKLVGTWVGHQKNGNEYFHQVLEIDENGKGFYAFSIGDSYLKGWVFPIDIHGKTLNNGHITLNLKPIDGNPNINHILVLAPSGMNKEIGVLTINLLDDGSVFNSIGWSLVKTESKLGAFGLYDFAKSAL